jgi:hypothetical protein
MVSVDSTYDDDYPRHLGPPPVPNHTGRRIYNTLKPTHTVELDAGAFRAVWEHMEAEARRRFSRREELASARAYLRAVAAFRTAYWARHEPPEQPTPVKQGKRLLRKR